jgi:acetylornithine deacetylase
VIREIRSLLKQRGLAAEVMDDKAAAPCWPMETDANAELVRALMRVAHQHSAMGVHYFSDASVFAQAGTPAVLFGPGDIAQAHTPGEWVSVGSLERATEMLTTFLRDLP